MKIEIINKLRWKKVFIYLINKNHRVIKKELLNFVNNKTIFEIDLDKYSYCYFTNLKKRTEWVILSKNVLGLELRFNRRTKKYDPLLYIPNFNNNGRVLTLDFHDEENLQLQKNNEKKVHIFLPENYDENKKYGLLLYIDGQNLFDLKKVGKYTRKNDPYGSWQIDVSLNANTLNTNEEYIVAGIETTGKERLFELSLPHSVCPIKENLGDFYIDIKEAKLLETEKFIMNSLLPYLLENYSINENKLGIGGSSAGGLASYYIGLHNYKKFKFIFPYSNAISLYSDEHLFNFYKSLQLDKNIDKQPLIVSYIGKKGGLEKRLHFTAKETLNTLVKAGYSQNKIHYITVNSAEHNEILWRYAFAKSLEFIND